MSAISNFVIDFLGAENIETLKEKVIEIIISQIKDDFENSQEYLISPYQVQDIFDEAITEVKSEIKENLKERLKSQIEKHIEENNLFPESFYAKN